MREKKTHLYFDSEERKLLLHSLVELKNQLIQQGRYTDPVDELIWEEHADTKASQLLFCDLSTPKNDGTFNVYDDIREKLIARGVPAEQVWFIHEATTDAQKKELFGKVRSGEVRVLLGSTQKMGAGTNVQDRLVTIHNLDCPWRPSDVGRSLRTVKIKKNVEVTDNGKIII